MKLRSIYQLVLSGLFIALGIILPIIFHAFGGAGSIFLPMHIPVLLAGIFLNIPFAILVGVLTPLLSSIFTGMPPAFPMLPIMIVELPVYAMSIGIILQRTKYNLYLGMIFSMVMGRLAAGVVVFILVSLFSAKLPGPFIFIKGAIITGLPGILIQLILIPALVMAIEKWGKANGTKRTF